MHWPLPTCLTFALLLGGMFAPANVFGARDDEVLEPGAPAAAENAAAFGELTVENFDQWVFQGTGNQAASRDRIASHFKLRFDELCRDCELSQAQREKLTLAGAVDTKRFFDEVEIVRQKFLAVKDDQNAWQLIWPEIMPLQAKLALGLHGEHSFFAKTVRKILTPGQAVKHQAIIDSRGRFQDQACIEIVILGLDDSLGLTDSRRQALVKLLTDETKPPKSYNQQHCYWIVMARLSKLPADKLHALLDNRQWSLLRPRLDQARGVEASLKQQGLLVE